MPHGFRIFWLYLTSFMPLAEGLKSAFCICLHSLFMYFSCCFSSAVVGFSTVKYVLNKCYGGLFWQLWHAALKTKLWKVKLPFSDYIAHKNPGNVFGKKLKKVGVSFFADETTLWRFCPWTWQIYTDLLSFSHSVGNVIGILRAFKTKYQKELWYLGSAPIPNNLGRDNHSDPWSLTTLSAFCNIGLCTSFVILTNNKDSLFLGDVSVEWTHI